MLAGAWFVSAPPFRANAASQSFEVDSFDVDKDLRSFVGWFGDREADVGVGFSELEFALNLRQRNSHI